MHTYHDRTLALLAGDGIPQERPVDTLLAWAETHGIRLPLAYLDWAKLDGGGLLHKYSGDDWFWFDHPRVVVAQDGARGLLFNSENQNNFDRMVMLDQGDDPPVLMAWLGQPPWVTNAERFSDAVFAQVFDWQYWLEFDPADPGCKEMAYAGSVNLKSDACLAVLRRTYQELCQTALIVESTRYAEHRFLISPMLRVTVTVAEDRSTVMRITGRPTDAVRAFEAEVTAMLRAEGA